MLCPISCCSLASYLAKYFHNKIAIAFMFWKMFFFTASGILTGPLCVPASQLRPGASFAALEDYILNKWGKLLLY